MTIHWLPFLGALVLLLLPPFVPAEIAHRLAPNRRPPSAKLPGLLRVRANWVDLLRAFAGTYLLAQFAFTIDPKSTNGDLLALLLKAGVLAAGVVLQTVRWRAEPVFLAPVLYLTGVTVWLPGYAAGGFAMFAGWMFAAGGKSAHLVLPVAAAAVAAGGYLLNANLMLLAVNAGLLVLPYVIGYLFEKPLFLVVKERKLV